MLTGWWTVGPLCGCRTWCIGLDKLWGLCLLEGRRKERLLGVVGRRASERGRNRPDEAVSLLSLWKVVETQASVVEGRVCWVGRGPWTPCL